MQICIVTRSKIRHRRKHPAAFAIVAARIVLEVRGCLVRLSLVVTKIITEIPAVSDTRPIHNRLCRSWLPFRLLVASGVSLTCHRLSPREGIVRDTGNFSAKGISSNKDYFAGQKMGIFKPL